MFKTLAVRSVLLSTTLVALSGIAAETTPPVAVTQILKTTNSWDGKPIIYPPGSGEVTALRIEIQPGAETGWHQHPVPSFALVLEGTLQITLRDGSSRRFGAGEVFAEVVNTSHNGRNVGAAPVKLLVVYAGASGIALTNKD
ncbi:MAG: cupin domain-containing protein [Chitinophagaceae bacterium]|nr:cupin domain-containing protein [Rubrivivax sp.]